MKYKISDLASFVEIISAFAVVISLIYVGVQVNDNAAAVRAASANDANVAVQAWYLQIGSNQQAAENYYRALMSEEALPNQEEFQFLMVWHALFLAFQNSYLLAEEGTIDIEHREALTRAILGVKDTPGLKRFWRQRKSYLQPVFADYVDQLLKQETNTSMDIYRMVESEPERE